VLNENNDNMRLKSDVLEGRNLAAPLRIELDLSASAKLDLPVPAPHPLQASGAEFFVAAKPMNTILYIIAAPLFLISITGYIIVKLRLNPKDGSDLDDYYYEFEDQHPAYARYLKWSQITFTAAVVAALLLFLALVL